jgi:hypothetical protein
MSANDRFDRYYAEKLWELIPSIHRHEDGIAEHPGALRALIEIIAEQAALLRRSQDRLWDDAFIDLCDDWAVPYLGELVATRMISALNKRGRRVDVAKTIYYRRRKGTPRVLEELIADICGWEGKVVESFRFLGRHRHGLDPRLPDLLEPAPGWADLRVPRLAELTDSAWDRFAHTPDLRRPRGQDGRWNIPRVTFHLYRLAAFELDGVTPRPRAGNTTFTFDPSGRDVPLFMPRQRAAPRRRAGAEVRYDWEQWTSARPWEVPAPMGCRVLGHAEYELDEALLFDMALAGVSQAARDELVPLLGWRFGSEKALRDHIDTLANDVELLSPGNWDRIRRGALIAACGKHDLYPDAVAIWPSATAPIARERIAAGNLDGFTLAVPAAIDAVIDPVRGRFRITAAAAPPGAVRVSYWYGFGGAIGAGGHDRRATVVDSPDVVVTPAPPTGGVIAAADLPANGISEIFDSATYVPAGSANPGAVVRLVIQAANFARPYVRLAGDWVFTASAAQEGVLEIDGLWIGASAAASVILRGAWSKVVLRHTTLDPGGVDCDGGALPPVRLWIEGQIDELRIERSITAAIATRNAGLVDRILVTDSILDGTLSGGTALATTPVCVDLARVTVLGKLDVERLYATDTLVTGAVDVTDTQHGCFRFSAAPPGSRLPHPYRSVELAGTPLASERFGDPDYTWLAETAPDELERGGEHGSEIGAWSAQLNPIKQDGLASKVQEYLPFGLSPVFIRET